MADTDLRRRPIRGGLWGVLLGLGLALLALNSKIISLSLVSLALVTMVGIVLGVLWGLFAPARAPKGPPPSPDREPAPISVADGSAADAPGGQDETAPAQDDESSS